MPWCLWEPLGSKMKSSNSWATVFKAVEDVQAFAFHAPQATVRSSLTSNSRLRHRQDRVQFHNRQSQPLALERKNADAHRIQLDHLSISHEMTELCHWVILFSSPSYISVCCTIPLKIYSLRTLHLLCVILNSVFETR